MNAFRTALLAILAAAAANGAILVTPEIPIADPSRAKQEGSQYPSAIASDGDQFLAFWSSAAGVNLAHIGSDGRLLSSRLAVPLVRFNYITNHISVSWTGSVYLAAWDADEAPFKPAVFAATFSRSGEMLSGPIRVAAGGTRTGALASSGHRSLLCYGNGAVNVALFDADGSLIKTGVPIPLDSIPIAASDGNEFAVVWQTSHLVTITTPDGWTGQGWSFDYHLLRLDDDGHVRAPPIALGATDLSEDGFGVAYGGGLYVIAAIERHPVMIRDQIPRLVRFVFDPRSASVTRLPAIDLSDGTHDMFATASVLWNGDRFVAYLMKYQSTSLFLVQTLSFSGAAEEIASQPATVYTGSGLYVSWITAAANGRNLFGSWGEYSQIYGALLDATATASTNEGAHLLSVGWSRQLNPQIATSGVESLVVWVEETGEPLGRLLGARVAASGAPIDRTPFEIAAGVLTSTPPCVVFAGNRYFVAWHGDQYAITVRTVGRDASLGAPITIGPGEGMAAASNGTTILLVVGGVGITGYRFDAFGQPIDTTPLRIGHSTYYSTPQVASNGNDFFVAWSDGFDGIDYCNPACSPNPNFKDIFGARVSATGAVDAAPLPIATGPKDQSLSAVASNGRDYLVAYLLTGYEGQSPYTRIAVKRVLREGQLDGVTATDDGTTIIDEGGISSTDSTGSLAGDARGYWFTNPFVSGAMIRMDPKGSPTVRITAGPPWSSISVAPSPDGAVRIAYSRRTAGAFDGTSRVFVRYAGEPLSRRQAVRH